MPAILGAQLDWPEPRSVPGTGLHFRMLNKNFSHRDIEMLEFSGMGSTRRTRTPEVFLRGKTCGFWG